MSKKTGFVASRSKFLYVAVGENIPRAMFITFEGLDYSGKSTQIKLLAERLQSTLEGASRKEVLVLREPGGTRIGEQIRSILLDKSFTGLTDVGELFLFSASRAQLVQEVIKPALAQGTVVIADRYYDSTTAYQGWARGLSLEAINVINACATQGLEPALTFFVDIEVQEMERRMRAARANKDRMESNGEQFYRRVREGYLMLANREARFVKVDGAKPVEQVHEIIWSKVLSIMK